MAKRGFFKDESQKREFFLIAVSILWMFQLVYCFLGFSLLDKVGQGEDQYYWFTLQNPGGGSLSYPFLAISYFNFLHYLSGDNLLLFYRLSMLASFLVFLGVLALFLKMGIDPLKLFLLSVIFQPQLLIILLRFDIIPIALSLLAVWLFHSGKRMEGWLALLAGAFFKVFPIFFAPLFLAMELKDFNRNSAIRIAVAAAISILAFNAFQDNMSTVLFHSARGIQIESVYSNILLIANGIFSLGIHPEYNYGGYQLVLPPFLDLLPTLALALQIGAVLAISALFWLEGARKEKFFIYSFLIAFAMVLTCKILSSQFVFWPLFFAIPILAIPWKGKKFAVPLMFPFLFFGLSLVTEFVYPFGWGKLVEMSPDAILLLTIRNLLLISLFSWFFLNRNNKLFEN